MTGGYEALGDGFNDLLMNFIDGEVALNKHYAVRLASGDFAILLPDAAVERFLLLLESAFILAILGGGALIATAGAFQAGLKGRQQKQCEVRLQIAADEPVELKHRAGAQLAAAALVGLGGVGKAVAEDDFSSSECWLNDFGDGLSTVGKHERHLGHGRNMGGAGVQQQGSDAVAGGGSAGLASDYGVQAAFLHPGRQAFDLRGFTRTVETFERNE